MSKLIKHVVDLIKMMMIKKIEKLLNNVYVRRINLLNFMIALLKKKI